jgi:hypothetical protein
VLWLGCNSGYGGSLETIEGFGVKAGGGGFLLSRVVIAVPRGMIIVDSSLSWLDLALLPMIYSVTRRQDNCLADFVS